MPNIPNNTLGNEGRPDRVWILSELLHASTPAFYCRSWVPYLRIVSLAILVVVLAILVVVLIAPRVWWSEADCDNCRLAAALGAQPQAGRTTMTVSADGVGHRSGAHPAALSRSPLSGGRPRTTYLG